MTGVSPDPAVVDDVVLTTSGGFVSSVVGTLGNLLPSTRKSHPSQDEPQLPQDEQDEPQLAQDEQDEPQLPQLWQQSAAKPIPASGTGCQRLEFACSQNWALPNSATFPCCSPASRESAGCG